MKSIAINTNESWIYSCPECGARLMVCHGKENTGKLWHDISKYPFDGIPIPPAPKKVKIDCSFAGKYFKDPTAKIIELEEVKP